MLTQYDTLESNDSTHSTSQTISHTCFRSLLLTAQTLMWSRNDAVTSADGLKQTDESK